MVTASFVLILITLGFVFVIWKKSQKPQLKQMRPQRAFPKDELRIENVQAGGVISLTNVGPEMEDFDVKVQGVHTYRQGTSSWYEIEGDKGGEKVFLQFEEDDGLEMSISIKELKMRDLGLNRSDLDKIDDAEEGGFTYGGVKYYYEDSDKAIFYRNGDDDEAEPYYYWDFEDDDGKNFISIEKWGDNELDIALSIPVKASQVTVYSLN